MKGATEPGRYSSLSLFGHDVQGEGDKSKVEVQHLDISADGEVMGKGKGRGDRTGVG